MKKVILLFYLFVLGSLCFSCLDREDAGNKTYMDNGDYWSGTWKPCMPRYDFFEVRHGQGYSILTSKTNGIRFEKTVFVDVEDPVEVWKVELKNETSKKRRLSLFTYFDWCLGNWSDTHREFHKTAPLRQGEKQSSKIRHRCDVSWCSPPRVSYRG